MSVRGISSKIYFWPIFLYHCNFFITGNKKNIKGLFVGNILNLTKLLDVVYFFCQLWRYDISLPFVKWKSTSILQDPYIRLLSILKYWFATFINFKLFCYRKLIVILMSRSAEKCFFYSFYVYDNKVYILYSLKKHINSVV